MLVVTKVKMSNSEKKVNRTTYNISSIKHVTRKFLGVSCCWHQNNGKEVYKKSVRQGQTININESFAFSPG